MSERTYTVVASGFLVACVSSTPLHAVLLPIVNPGFEIVSRPLTDGEITNGAGGNGILVGTRPDFHSPPQFNDTVEVPGWRTFIPADPMIPITTGVLNPPTIQGVEYVVGYEGAYVASGQQVPMQQTLPVFVEANTHYRLTFLSGAGHSEPGDGVYVGLMAVPDQSTFYSLGAAGTTTLGLTSHSPPFGTDGQMLPYDLNYTSPAELPPELTSKYLAIIFIGSDGIPRMNFDDFALDATSLSLTCDFDADGDIDDLDSMLAIGPINVGVAAGGNEPFDLTGDGMIDIADRDQWLAIAATENGFDLPYQLGDANLDGLVTGSDFLVWYQARFTASLAWSDGDFNADGLVNGRDFLLWNQQKSLSPTAASVPEFAWSAVWIAIVALCSYFDCRRRLKCRS